jgi:serine/threonine protein kinase
VRYLGGGGFADVFLYTQVDTELPVAVKVMLRPTTDEVDRRQFYDEASLMARLSAHPFIVDIHRVATATDGRPYLIMKYYGDDNLEERAKRLGRLGVDEVLRLGVQVSSAVHTAHARNILHRDIKPANVLLDSYGFPGLTDFGVAGVVADLKAQDALSPQYTAPEVHVGQAGVPASDVYALAATLYRLLAGRAPFEYAGQPNRMSDVTPRVLQDPVPTLNVPDVPPMLETLLRRSLAKAPADRPESVLAFGRALQEIERSRGFTPTPFADVVGAGLGGAGEPHGRNGDGQDGEHTSLGPQVIDPHRPGSGSGPSEPPLAVGTPVASSYRAVPADRSFTEDRLTPRPAAEETTWRNGRPVRADAVLPLGEVPPPERVSRWRWAGAAAAVVVVVVVGLGVVLRSGGETPPAPGQTSTTRARPTLVVPELPAVPEAVQVAADAGSATISWQQPDRQDGDRWIVVVEGATYTGEPVDDTRLQLAGVVPGATVCVHVSTVRAGGQQSEPSSPPVCRTMPPA